MVELLIIPYMAVTSGWSGGSLIGHKLFGKLTFIPEILFSLPFAYALYPLIGPWCVLGSVWSYLFMQTGTAPGLHWGKGGYNPEKQSRIKPLVDWVASKFGWHPSTVQYCRLYMSAKGFLICLPVGGIIGALLWPLGYEIGNRLDKHVYSEVLSGAGAGVAVFMLVS